MNGSEVDALIESLIGVVPKYRYVPEFKPDEPYENVYAITYDGVNHGDKKTKVFAYLGFPADLKDKEKRKAIVLVHGGGGAAYLSWVKKWNDLGYIAIAMNTAGGFPLKKNAWIAEGYGDGNETSQDLYGVFAEEGYTEIPTETALTRGDDDVDKQRYYHYVSSVILAANIIFSLPNVDVTKVGITGISWGGIITSTVIGYDNRFAFAIPVYGSAYISEAFVGRWKESFGDAKVKELWAAERIIANAKMPILWLCWNDDCAFSINSNSKSYLATYKNNEMTVMSAVDNMLHSHIDAWKRAESYAFAQSVADGGIRLTRIEGDYDSRNIDLTLKIDPRVGKNDVKARLYYLEDYPVFAKRDKYVYKDLVFSDLFWKTRELSVSGERVAGEVPREAKIFYVEVETVIGGEKIITTTPCENYRAK